MAFIPRRAPRRISAQTAEEALARAEQIGCVGIPFDCARLLRRMGCTVEESRDLGNASGVLDRIGSSWFCRTNAFQNVRRQNLTLAHQLAHMLLHESILPFLPHEDVILTRPSGLKGIEAEALDFACALLVPEDRLQEQIRQGRRKLTDLADFFGVPLDAMRRRAWTLGLIPAF